MDAIQPEPRSHAFLTPHLKPCAKLHMIINSSLAADSPGSGGKVMGLRAVGGNEMRQREKIFFFFFFLKVYTVVLESETVDVVARVWGISILSHLSVRWIYG